MNTNLIVSDAKFIIFNYKPCGFPSRSATMSFLVTPNVLYTYTSFFVNASFAVRFFPSRIENLNCPGGRA